jgi:SAM-dependent methyltransferase
MTEPAGLLEIARFYDDLAPEYDAMTGFERRFAQEKPFFRLLIENNGIRTAVDAGSGTGFHSLLLAQLGVSVTAVDVSGEMLARLRLHAQEMGLTVNAVQSTFQALAGRLPSGIDAVFSLGNSMAHLLTPEELAGSIRSFAAVLKPGGIFFAQLLNYDRILRNRERIQSVKEDGGSVFVRFYDFAEQLLVFNILTLRKTGGGYAHALQSVRLRPIQREEFCRALTASGFGEIKAFGSVAMEEYDPLRSKDLVLFARLSGGTSARAANETTGDPTT